MRQLALLLILAMPAGVRAQVVDIQPGARVRFKAPDLTPTRVTGTVISRTANSIVVASPTAEQYQIDLKNTSDLEISLGKSRAAGAMKGFCWVGGISGSLMAILITADGGNMLQPAPILFTGFVATYYGSIGALIGAAVGSEKWSRIAVPGVAGVSPSFGVTPGGVGVGGHFRFR